MLPRSRVLAGLSGCARIRASGLSPRSRWRCVPVGGWLRWQASGSRGARELGRLENATDDEPAWLREAAAVLAHTAAAAALAPLPDAQDLPAPDAVRASEASPATPALPRRSGGRQRRKARLARQVAIGDSCGRSGGFFCVPSVRAATRAEAGTSNGRRPRKTYRYK